DTEAKFVYFKRVTSANLFPVLALSETLSVDQRKMVADNSVSLAQAYCSDNAWVRAVYMNEKPIGFIMVHYGQEIEEGILCPGAFLWRFMIAGPFQGKGYGKTALDLLIQQLKAQGYRELYTSAGQGDGSPLEFYKRLGFMPTGDMLEEEIELVLRW
ncbi:MAG: GNAT family N-acetyltransferase, partial [Anaerolineaceae bacterium]